VAGVRVADQDGRRIDHSRCPRGDAWVDDDRRAGLLDADRGALVLDDPHRVDHCHESSFVPRTHE
jgi:hypothetical protein